MIRALIVKTDSRMSPPLSKLPKEYIELDKLSHGLISMAFHKGHLPSDEAFLFKPTFGVLDQMVLLPTIKKDNLESLQNLWGASESIYGSGSFTENEWNKLKEYFPNIKKWGEVLD